MATYYFTNKNSDESISVHDAKTLQEAIEFFAGVKKLDIETFLEIYDVKRKIS